MLLAYRLREIVEEIQANPPDDYDPKEPFTFYRLHKDSGVAHSTIFHLLKGEPVSTIHSSVVVRLLEALNNRRNKSLPEYTLNDLLVVVSESGRRRRQKNG